MEVNLDHTIKVIIDCWNRAETVLQKTIQEFAPSVGEEHITRHFHIEFSKLLKQASDRKAVEAAFREDLRAAFSAEYQLYPPELDSLSGGLIASVALHPHQTEKNTGADIGLVISRPSLSISPEHDCEFGHARSGLLCQAKMRSEKGIWGKLSKKQLAVLPLHLSYAALLLYSYRDKERRKLRPFRWQLCNGIASIDVAQSWLKTGRFPPKYKRSSADILEQLATGSIGTSDQTAIDKYVAPTGVTVMEIRIGWPNGIPPTPPVWGYEITEQRVKQYTYVTR